MFLHLHLDSFKKGVQLAELQFISAFEIAIKLKSQQIKLVDKRTVKFVPIKARDEMDLSDENSGTVYSHASFRFMTVVFTILCYGMVLLIARRYINVCPEWDIFEGSHYFVRKRFDCGLMWIPINADELFDDFCALSIYEEVKLTDCRQ
jgi:hypothetical protein